MLSQIARRLAVSLIVLLALVLGASANPLLLINSSTGEVLFEQESGQPWHPASLTKLMTAYVAFEAIAQGRVTLSTPVTISQRAWNVAPSKSGLPVDSAISLEDALYILVVKSANDVAVAIAETIGGTEAGFVAEMNSTAAAMGLTATHYENPHGLHDPAQVSTARDLAVLALYIRTKYPQYLPMFQTEKVILGDAVLDSNNDLLTHFAGTTGMKTGYVCASGLNIVATFERGQPLMAVVLGGSSARERGEMTAQMVMRALSGGYPPTGVSVLNLPNAVGVPPVNMRPLLCGADARDYVAAREAAFPLGLDGQMSYLTEEVTALVHVATDLGRVRNVPYPRQRPFDAPVVVAIVEAPALPSVLTLDTPPETTGTIVPLGTAIVPLPRPRPWPAN